MKNAILLLGTLALVGCSHFEQGNPLVRDMEIASEIKKGESTKADVIALLGEPNMVNIDAASGLESWMYQHTSVDVSLLGRSNTSIRSITVVFDRNGVVTDVPVVPGTAIATERPTEGTSSTGATDDVD